MRISRDMDGACRYNNFEKNGPENFIPAIYFHQIVVDNVVDNGDMCSMERQNVYASKTWV